uniref:Uncharacterized protein n=1 Tax=Hippocampus comes TaxID=109280 RepID=A0A3Q3D572_HIPCM
GAATRPCAGCSRVGAVLFEDNDTSLSGAASEGSANLVRLLLARGSDPLRSDQQRETALTVASRRCHRDVLRALLDWVRVRDARTAAAMLEHADNDGWTALRSAARGGHGEAVRLLLDAGADVDGAYDGHSALSAALLEGHGEVAELLMRRGADTDVRDAEGRPLLYLLVLEGRCAAGVGPRRWSASRRRSAPAPTG